MNKIAFIIPYFGKWPEWIDLYFHSCTKNPEIDWYFFTDCQTTDINYPNIHLSYLSFEEYCQKVGDKLGIDFHPNNAYKLCDIRVFNGFIHKELISDYEFWGFGDIDLVWGDIFNFYTEDILAKYDVFSTHGDRISGHLAFFRNNEKYRNLCFNIVDWKNKLTMNKYFGLDEKEFSYLIYSQSKYIMKFYSKIILKIFNWRDAWVIYYNLLSCFSKIFFLKQRHLYFKEQHTTPILANDGRSFKYDSDTWYYNDGKVINAKTGEEHIYFHFMIYKKNGFRSDHFWENGCYRIDRHDFSRQIKIDKSGFEAI